MSKLCLCPFFGSNIVTEYSLHSKPKIRISLVCLVMLTESKEKHIMDKEKQEKQCNEDPFSVVCIP